MVGRSDMAWLSNWAPYSLYVANPCQISFRLRSRADTQLRAPTRMYQLPIVASQRPLASQAQYGNSFAASPTTELRPNACPPTLVEKLVLEMTLSLLLETQGMRKIAASSSVEQGLYARAMAYIAAYKTDPDLTPGKVAASSMNISAAPAAARVRGAGVFGQRRDSPAPGRHRGRDYSQTRRTDTSTSVRSPNTPASAVRADLRRAIATVHGCTPTQLRVSA